MTIDVRRADDDARFLATDKLVWFDEVTERDPDELLAGVPREHRFAAHTDDDPEDAHAGIYGYRPMELGIPGACVPVAGLTWVGVHPDHRRRGVLSAMLRHHFVDCRERGLAISALHASEPAIYGRFGYGTAALELAVDVGRGTTFTAPGLDEEAAQVRVRLGPTDHSGSAGRMRAVDRALADRVPGIIVGLELFYSRQIEPWPEEMRDKEPIRVLFAQRDGRDVGYATFRRTHKWSNARPGGEVRLGLLSGDPATRLALLRRLVDLDLMGTVKIERLSPDDPLFTWVGGHRATGDVRTYDSTWVRPVEVDAAWTARSYDADGDVVAEVTDASAPWNAGRWRLSASGGEGSAQRTDDAADVSVDVSVLGAGYLGRSVAPLLRAGAVDEHRRGAFLELARMMRTTLEPEPAMGF